MIEDPEVSRRLTSRFVHAPVLGAVPLRSRLLFFPIRPWHTLTLPRSPRGRSDCGGVTRRTAVLTSEQVMSKTQSYA
jgi:hypothetical protein